MADESARLVTVVNALPRPWLIGVDIDGTLAPIVARPEQSTLAPGAIEALEALAGRVGVMVAVVSGRPLADLRQKFGLPQSVMLLGSHGAEVGSEIDQRTPQEQSAIDSALATLERVAKALAGSWIEDKPLAVALHVRQSDPQQAAAALAELEPSLRANSDFTVHRGHMVLEVAVRPTSKASAFCQLSRRLDSAATIFIGDDDSDEKVFGSLGPNDVTIKVGPGPTIAAHRLDAPADVVELLLALANDA